MDWIQFLCLILTQSKTSYLGKGMQRSCERKSNRTLTIMEDITIEERLKVNQQEQKTPGRRGEKIKQEEIDKEIVRRDKINNTRISAKVIVVRKPLL